jgi:pseudaminic acid cytidylyltransferase
MDNQKKFALIPARGGSKRIPKKNIKDFHGKPIISYSIDLAKRVGIFDEIIVSTDDKEIAQISQKYGAAVPYYRPKEISDDFSTLFDVVDYTLANIDSDYKYCCILLPTSPFLTPKYLLRGLKMIEENNSLFSFSASLLSSPFQRSFKINKNKKCEMFYPEEFKKRSQDLEEAYQDNGQFYWIDINKYFKCKNKNFFDNHSTPIVMPKYLSHDIDSLEDWEYAELMFYALKSTHKEL